MEFLKKIFNKKDTKNNGLKILNLFGDYDEKKGKLTIENENKELEQALADCATTYVETLTDLSQMPPAERDQVRIDARKKHNTEIKQLRNNKAAVLLQKYQNKYKNTERKYTKRQEKTLKEGYKYLKEDIQRTKEMGLKNINLIYVNENNETEETLVSLDDIDMYLCDEYILDMKGAFCPAIGELEI